MDKGVRFFFFDLWDGNLKDFLVGLKCDLKLFENILLIELEILVNIFVKIVNLNVEIKFNLFIYEGINLSIYEKVLFIILKNLIWL